MIGFRTQTQTRIQTHAALLLCATLALGGCANANPYFNPAKSHHTPEGFRNNSTDGVVRPFSDLLRWKWAAIRDDLPPAPKTPTPVQAPDLPLISANAHAGSAMQPMVTWIGHATALVQASGLNVLTDPIFSERAFPVQIAGPKRTQPPGVGLTDLPPIDVVIVSHNHYDHLDRLSVIALNERANGSTMFLVPLGNKPWMENIGITNVIELDWWDSITLIRNQDGKPARAVPGQAGVEFFLTARAALVGAWPGRPKHHAVGRLVSVWPRFSVVLWRRQRLFKRLRRHVQKVCQSTLASRCHQAV